jgi:hypothetical protein
MWSAFNRWLVAKTFWQSYRRFFLVIVTLAFIFCFTIPKWRRMPLTGKAIVSIFAAGLSSFRFAQTYKDGRKKTIQ